jgi:hypothetical protein
MGNFIFVLQIHFNMSEDATGEFVKFVEWLSNSPLDWHVWNELTQSLHWKSDTIACLWSHADKGMEVCGLFYHKVTHLIPNRPTEKWGRILAWYSTRTPQEKKAGVRIPVGSRILSSPRRPDRLWGQPNLLSIGYRGLFPGGKAAGAWS